MQTQASSGKDGLSSIYDDSASFGRLLTKIITYTITVVFLIVIIVMIYKSFNNKNFINGKAMVIDKVDDNKKTLCTKGFMSKNNQQKYDCVLVVKYKVQDKDYIQTIRTMGSDDYTDKINKEIDIQYNVNDPNDVRLPESTFTNVIIILMLVFFLLFIWIRMYIVNRYKFVASTVGVMDTVNLFNIFK